MGTALQSLALTASLFSPAPRPAVAPKGPVKEVLRISVAEIVSNQERAWYYDQAGAARVGFRAAFDPKAELWIKLRDQDFVSAHPLKDFDAGILEDFPDGRTRIVVENGVLRAYPADPPQTPQAHVSVPTLVRDLYDRAEHVSFTPVDYAVVYEDGGTVPASLSLIRQDDAGRLFVGYYSKAEIADISWFVGINGTLYGVRLEGPDLVFYSEPAPSVKNP